MYTSGMVAEAAAIGVSHHRLGQAIVLVVVSATDGPVEEKAVIKHFQKHVPTYMVPLRVITQSALARNPNGKIDRKTLAAEYENLFVSGENK